MAQVCSSHFFRPFYLRDFYFVLCLAYLFSFITIYLPFYSSIPFILSYLFSLELSVSDSRSVLLGSLPSVSVFLFTWLYSTLCTFLSLSIYVISSFLSVPFYVSSSSVVLLFLLCCLVSDTYLTFKLDFFPCFSFCLLFSFLICFIFFPSTSFHVSFLYFFDLSFPFSHFLSYVSILRFLFFFPSVFPSPFSVCFVFRLSLILSLCLSSRTKCGFLRYAQLLSSWVMLLTKARPL